MAYELIERTCSGRYTNIGYFRTREEVVGYLLQEYDIKTDEEQLEEAIRAYYGKAYLYFFWGEIEVIERENYKD